MLKCSHLANKHKPLSCQDNLMACSSGEETGGAETGDLLVPRDPQTESSPWTSDGTGLSSWQWEHLAEISPAAAHRSQYLLSTGPTYTAVGSCRRFSSQTNNIKHEKL